jgi:FAD/FMN-containing dehydrogenase
MTQIAEPVAALRSAMAGTVVVPGDADYDTARRVWNASIDRQPAYVARCAGTPDVVAALAFAREHGLEISVRGGGHSVPGISVGDGGITIDLGALNSVHVDPQTRRARCGGGALLADLDAATQEHGLAVPAGEIGHTGVGGLTLGGGMGWLTRQHGLTLDNLVSAEVVLADGRVVRASDIEHTELFWAIRGGGGNFGIVTEFEFQLHPVGPMISVGLFFYGLDQAAAALRLARDTITDLPPEVSFQIVGMNAPPAPFVPEQYQNEVGVALVVVGFGSPEQHAEVSDRVRAAVPPLFEMITPMPYTALQTMFDEAMAWGLSSYEKSDYIAEISDEVIDVFTGYVAGKRSPMSVAHMYVLNGAYCAVDEDATAFSGGRTPRLGVFIIAITPDPAAIGAERAWARAFHEALAPLAIGNGTYVNSLASDDGNRIRDSYGSKYDRLARIKAQYDPQNLFHRNANIAPRD